MRDTTCTVSRPNRDSHRGSVSRAGHDLTPLPALEHGKAHGSRRTGLIFTHRFEAATGPSKTHLHARSLRLFERSNRDRVGSWIDHRRVQSAKHAHDSARL